MTHFIGRLTSLADVARNAPDGPDVVFNVCMEKASAKPSMADPCVYQNNTG